MIRNYCSLAFRTMLRHKGYTLLNVGGLALAMAICLLVIILIQDQRSYDRFHEKADRIVRILADRQDRDGTVHLAATPAYLAPQLESSVPAVEKTLRLGQIRANVIREGKSFYSEGLYAEPSFFEIFDFQLKRGDPATALAAPHQILLSEQTAERLFGEADPVGQPLMLEGEGDFVVTGVVATRGLKTHLRFDVLASFGTLEAVDWGKERLNDENNFWNFATYVLLRPGAGSETLEAALAAAAQRYSDPRFVMKVQPLTDIALGDNLSNEIATYSLPAVVVEIFALLGLVILLAAGFNYVGLTIARALGRAKEVGVRKTVGAGRIQIVAQFLVESCLASLAALILAAMLLPAFLPRVNGLTALQRYDIALTAGSVLQAPVLFAFLLFSLTVGLLSGLYPALYLSGFRPVRVLKGLKEARGAGSLLLRKTLVVAQFVLSLVFVVTVVLLSRQFKHMSHADYGFPDEGLINVPLQGNDYGLLREEWLRHPGVLDVSATYEPPATGATMGVNIVTASNDTLPAVGYSIDPPFIENLGLTLLAGTTVAAGRPGVVVNENMLQLLRLNSPAEAIGVPLNLSRFPEPQPIVGVVQDYWFTAAVNPMQPLVLFYDPALFRWATIRLHPSSQRETIPHLVSVWERVDSIHPFEYQSFDDLIRNSDITRGLRDMTQIVALLSAIAVALACMGLLSMAAMRAETRTKEVGIRKVLGANASGLVLLLSGEFLKLLALAVVIAAPLAWKLNSLWLDSYAYRTRFVEQILVIAMGVVLALALLAVGSQALRAASADPVKSLRYE